MEVAVPGRPADTSAPTVRAIDASAIAVPLFGGAMLLSGFLLFLVEPMIARMILPILGGAPMVWNGCVVFFQIAMLAGYGYAFAASRWLPVGRHVLVHAALLAAPALVLPVLIRPASFTPPTGNPLVWLLLLLTVTIGLPFFVLSTTASVLQHWLSRTDHPAGRDPYFLYVASNVGCLLALASYPAIIEPTLTLGEQSRLWAVGYAVFAALAVVCGFFAWRRRADEPRGAVAAAPATTTDAVASAPITLARRARWVALAFVPSSLMLAVTSYISTDVAAVPLLWIMPLALYLLTFTLAFGKRADAASRIARRALPLLVVPLALSMIARVQEPLVPIVMLHLMAFATIALNCHADLAADRPEAARLTEFYFWLSFGGMLGGLFNTLVAPQVFTSVAEYPLAVLMGCLLVRPMNAATGRPVRAALVPIAIALLTAVALLIPRATEVKMSIQLAALAVPALLVFTQRRQGARFGWSATAMLAAGLMFAAPAGRILYATRTFFGVYRVIEDPKGRFHALAHGTTLHGMQALAPDRRREALTYFHSTGPFGQAWRALPSAARGHSIAVVGLGAGTLATYASPDQRWTFFEIDPAIERIARTPEYFTFLPTCDTRCTVVTGDARISLRSIQEHSYDLFVLDAFSSDSIPLHLMTREAMDLYLSRLAPGGAIILHISNRHLKLAPIVGRLAADRGLTAVRRLEASGKDWPEGKNGSEWIALSRNPADVASLVANNEWTPLTADASVPLWTDDFSNILSVLSLR